MVEKKECVDELGIYRLKDVIDMGAMFMGVMGPRSFVWIQSSCQAVVPFWMAYLVAVPRKLNVYECK